MRDNKRPPAQQQGLLKFLPFSNASPAMLSYYIYGVTLLTFGLLAATGVIDAAAFAIHAVAALALVVFFNLFVHCMVFGGCMKSALGVVTVVQVAHIGGFLYWTLQHGKSSRQ